MEVEAIRQFAEYIVKFINLIKKFFTELKATDTE